MMNIASNSGRHERLTREEKLTLSLLRVAADLATIRKDLGGSDFERLPSLASLFQAADQLIAEMGFADDD